MMVAAPLSTILYNSKYGPRSVVLALGISPIIVLPFIIFLKENKVIEVKTVRDRMQDIWTTVQSRSVWQPMAFVSTTAAYTTRYSRWQTNTNQRGVLYIFRVRKVKRKLTPDIISTSLVVAALTKQVYIYNLLQVGNGAWRQFLKSVLVFTEAQINYLLIAAYVLLYLGTLLYKQCFLRVSWRRVYQVCILLNGVFSMLQLLLIRGQTFGLSPFLFALGDEAFAEFVRGVQFLVSRTVLNSF